MGTLSTEISICRGSRRYRGPTLFEIWHNHIACNCMLTDSYNLPLPNPWGLNIEQRLTRNLLPSFLFTLHSSQPTPANLPAFLLLEKRLPHWKAIINYTKKNIIPCSPAQPAAPFHLFCCSRTYISKVSSHFLMLKVRLQS